MSRSDLFAGIRDVAPVLLGVVPVGMVFGATASGVGLSAVQAVFLSAFLYAGAAQLAIVELLRQGTALPIVVFAVLLVNFRYILYSASIASHFRRFPARWSWPAAHLLFDATYAISIAAFGDDGPAEKRWYYFGVAIPPWIALAGSTAAGGVLGARIPPGLGLDFALPLVFMALLFPVLEDYATNAAAVAGAVLAVVAAPLPFNLGLVAAVAAGIGAGLAAEVVVDR